MSLGAPRVIARYTSWAGRDRWMPIRRAPQLFPRHYQPRVPLGHRYYDPHALETLAWQVELARSHGVDAFAFDEAADGRAPGSASDVFLAHKDLRFEFCVRWINHPTGSRLPDRQLWRAQFDRLAKYWVDDRAIRVDGKPALLISASAPDPHLEPLIDYFRARAEGELRLRGLFLVCVVRYDFPSWETLRVFDAAALAQPTAAIHARMIHPRPVPEDWWLPTVERLATALPHKVGEALSRWLRRPKVYSYDEVWDAVLSHEPGRHLPLWRGAFVDVDNTPRRGEMIPTLFIGASPSRFGRNVRELLRSVAAADATERFLYLQSWNDWLSGCYLEPDEHNGAAYLNALRSARSDG